MSIKNKLASLRNTPSPQVLITDEQPGDVQRDLKHQGSSSSLAKFFNRSRTSSSTSLNNMTSNDKKKHSDKLEALQYNKGALLSPKMSQSSSHSASSQKSKNRLFHKNTHDSTSTAESSPVPKLELKRFFKNVIKQPSGKKEAHSGLHHLKDSVVGHHMKHHHHHNQHAGNNANAHNHQAAQSAAGSKAGTPEYTNQQMAQAQQMIQEKMLFGAETSHELVAKYGVPGKILGEGAGGSVAIVERPSDGRIFAVKQFRPKNARESDYDYTKKVQSEFFVGSTLHHQNIIETIDMLQEGLKFLIVMEYCPYDFFTIVMSGLLQRNEIACYFKQIVQGVQYLHSMGLAHRDLKLDNCVVTADGILKLIDFGSAVVFKYPFEEELIKAKGVVGSDPYLAPEVLSLTTYDPRPVDVWSIAIIFCCMTLRRFPWKVPKLSDPSYKAFTHVPPNAAPMSPDNSASTVDLDLLRNPDHDLSTQELHELQARTNMISNKTTTAFAPRSKSKGPYRLLRLLPHASRPLIGAMLELDAKKRISIEGVLSDEWFVTIETCHLEDNQIFCKAENHDHHLVTDEELTKIQEEREKQKKLNAQIAS